VVHNEPPDPVDVRLVPCGPVVEADQNLARASSRGGPMAPVGGVTPATYWVVGYRARFTQEQRRRPGGCATRVTTVYEHTVDASARAGISAGFGIIIPKSPCLTRPK
jgi:hypothetical protein